MDFALMLSIVGAFLTVMLGINAFFLRGIFTDLNYVKIQMAQIFENSRSKDKRISNLEEDYKSLEVRIRSIERGNR